MLSSPPLSSLLQPIGGRGAPTTSAIVKVRLQDAILTGKLTPGDRLVQEDLCQQLGVSRQPVREALRALESQGLITERGRGGGYVVRTYTEVEIRENYELRQLLEGRAAAQASTRADEEFCRNMELVNAAIRQAVETGDRVAVLEGNHRLHRLVWEQAARPQQQALIRQLWSSVTTFTPLLVPDRALLSLEEHQRIIDALRSRDSARAREAIADHIGRAARDFEMVRGSIKD